MPLCATQRPPACIAPDASRLPIAVLVITRDEEANLPECLASVRDWASQVFVVDSGSADGTTAIARRMGATVVTHPFEGYSTQRNWALEHLPVTCDWVLWLDADERVSPELARELRQWFGGLGGERGRQRERLAGFYIKRRLLFMGRWMRHGGYYPVWLLRLHRRAAGRWDGRSVNEHAIVDGPTAKLRHDLFHEDRRDLSHWIVKHDRYAALEAAELLRRRGGAEDAWGSPVGSQAARKRWLRRVFWDRLPLLLRPLAYFLYRYVLLLGFLDGRAGLVYHFLQGFWYPFLIDAKALEAERRLIALDGSEPHATRQRAA